MEALIFTRFNERHSHKWAILLSEKKKKLNLALSAIDAKNFTTAGKLVREIFRGGTLSSDMHDPGMEGSLLYHMAMVTKMATESKLILQELRVDDPQIDDGLQKYMSDFICDTKELLSWMPATIVYESNVLRRDLKSRDKITLYLKLAGKTASLERTLSKRDQGAKEELERLFDEWTKHVVNMRLMQEYETIRSCLILDELAKSIGVKRLCRALINIQNRFGRETVKTAFDVSTKIGKRKRDLSLMMFSDHFLERQMDMHELKGVLRFFNCPIYGCQEHITPKTDVRGDASSLFCKYLCYSHAKAMLEATIPFTFRLERPKSMAKDGVCEYVMEVARAPTSPPQINRHIPLVISWNVTMKCNLKCPHCYINASDRGLPDELGTDAAKLVIHQIGEVSRPLLILSGGEPLLRRDIFDLIQYGSERGFAMALGSNGTLIDDKIARRLKEAGTKTVSISLDSSIPERHDEFRGVEGTWKTAVKAIEALKNNDVQVQINTTVTKHNFDEIDDIMTLAEELNVENFHLFFLVPTGRGVKMEDISPYMYEDMIQRTLATIQKHRLNVKPACAPQFMRIARQMGISLEHMQASMRGCLAGLYYCRIYPTGDVTPCPYLPIKLGNIRETSFREIWFKSEILRKMRDFDSLEGKCGRCEFREVCGGCRARAYGLTSDFIDFCGDLHEPSELRGNYMAEEPWCIHLPKKIGSKDQIESKPTRLRAYT